MRAHIKYLLLIYIFCPLRTSSINPFSISISLAVKYVGFDIFKTFLAYVLVYSNGTPEGEQLDTLRISRYNNFAVVDNDLKSLSWTKLSVYTVKPCSLFAIFNHPFLCNVFKYQAAALFISSRCWSSYSVVDCL